MPAENKTFNNLADLFEKLLKKQEPNFAGSNGGKLMYFIFKYLREYSWHDLKSWKQVSSLFILARSFSFFRYPRKLLNNLKLKQGLI